ncbi:hypothetical protein ACTJKO_05470 [Curtobacterium sp. 22159]|uniref:hypothetical protein n=1 Tax=Curtobacterium sp. 22159 TaxID=3453882 RepID=UPI003F86B050
MPNTPRRLTTAVLLAGAALLLTGCTGHSTGNRLPEGYSEWMSQMSSQFDDAQGGGGGQLTVSDEDKGKAEGIIELQTKLAGPYDVLAVCRSTKALHLTIRDFTERHDENGYSSDQQSVLGQADIDCGSTARIPIDVPKGRDGIELDATTTDTSGRALFDTFVVARGADR